MVLAVFFGILIGAACVAAAWLGVETQREKYEQWKKDNENHS